LYLELTTRAQIVTTGRVDVTVQSAGLHV